MAVSLSCWLKNEKSWCPESGTGVVGPWKTLRLKRSEFPTVPQPLLLSSMNKMDERKNKNPLCLLDIHIAVDRAARIHSTFAGRMMMQNAQPPLRSNDVLN